MKEILTALCNYTVLREEDAYDALKLIATGSCTDSQVAAFLSAYIMRKPSVEELSGFKTAMMELCKPLKLSTADAIDIVGTGGDGKNSFNISTLSAIVVASSGCTVIKHGSCGASSVSGSSNVLEHLGYCFTSDASVLQRQLDEANICFLHAPLFHPAMKNIALVRKKIGIQTFFNLLGPLINPAQPSMRLLGVNSLETARTYNYLLQRSGQQYTIVHSLDGYDEISLTSPFQVISGNSERIIEPKDIGFSLVQPKDIDAGTTVSEAAAVFIKILKGEGTKEQANVVIANSGFAIQCTHPEKPLQECISLAREALVSLKAFKTFEQIVN